MQNTTLPNLIADSDFQVKCYGEYIVLSKQAEAYAKNAPWWIMKSIYTMQADYCRQTAQAHLDKHLEIEAKIRVLTNSFIQVSAYGLTDPLDILGF